MIEKQPASADSYLLLVGAYEKQGKKEEAEKIYKKAPETDVIRDHDKFRIGAQLQKLGLRPMSF